MGFSRDREKKLEESGVTKYLSGGDVEESFRLVLENGISPYSVQAIQMRAMLRMRKAAYGEANPLIDTALTMRQDALGWKMRGDCAFLQTRYEEAEDAYRKSIALAPEAGTYHDLGVAIVAQGRTEECLSYFQKATDLDPNRPEFHHHFAIMLVLAGQEAAGWDRMQWRLKVPGVCGSFPFPARYWKGEDLAGKTIVVRTEQGWGDGIMFARYLPWLTKRAKKVYFYGQRALIPLIQHFYPEVHCWAHDVPVPMDFDYHVNIMCFPRLIPFDEVEVPPVRKERGEGIGICWYGSPTHKADHLRSVPIEMFGRLAEAVDRNLISLGYGYFWKMENGVAVGENKPPFIDYGEVSTSQDWLQTANYVKDIDLIITVDTAIAHLGGFMGVPTWLLLPYVPDFRWGMSGTTTKWWPSMTLYRQPKLFDWESVFNKVAEDLEARYRKPEAKAA